MEIVRTINETSENQEHILVQIRNLKKTYNEGSPNEVNALRGINGSIQKGEIIDIVGASGSGKSTLLNMIGCMDTPSSGNIILDGKDITKLSSNDQSAVRKEKIGFIFQEMHLIANLNVVDNVLAPLIPYGMTKQDKKRAIDLLFKAGLGDRLTHKPGQLSGGQRQRVAICRALINNPVMILADEPTGNLDSKTGFEILNLLATFNKEKGTTIVIVTHDLRINDYANRTIKILDGEVIDVQKNKPFST